MMTKIEKATAFLDEKLAASKETEERLRAEGREDEAVLEKISGNIYGIFRTVLLTAKKAKHTEEDQLTFSKSNLSNIPRGWKIALEQAQKAGDAVREKHEQVKLEALTAIEKRFAEIWEDNHD